MDIDIGFEIVNKSKMHNKLQYTTTKYTSNFLRNINDIKIINKVLIDNIFKINEKKSKLK